MDATELAEYMKAQNEREVGKVPEAKPTPGQPEPKPETPALPVAATAGDPEGEEEDNHAQEVGRLPRSVRRELNQLRRHVGELEGRIAAYKEMGLSPKEAKVAAEAEPPAPPVKTEPQREDFASEAAYTKAIAEHATREVLSQEAENARMREHIAAMTRKAEEDAKLIPDYDKAVEAAKDLPVFSAEEQPTFMLLLGSSEYQALALHYYTQNPNELKDMLAMSGKPEKQVAEFRALEGHLKREYAKLRKAGAVAAAPPPAPKAAPTPPKLPAPSESVAVRGGSAPPMKESPYLADGKTINPAWTAQQNERERVHR